MYYVFRNVELDTLISSSIYRGLVIISIKARKYHRKNRMKYNIIAFRFFSPDFIFNLQEGSAIIWFEDIIWI